jgi:hypothetical protein
MERFRIPDGATLFLILQRTDWPWGRPSLVSNVYRDIFLRVKLAQE